MDNRGGRLNYFRINEKIGTCKNRKCSPDVNSFTATTLILCTHRRNQKKDCYMELITQSIHKLIDEKYSEKSEFFSKIATCNKIRL